MIDRLEFRFKGLSVCSTNNMYIPTKGKNKGAFLRKSPFLQQWQSAMKKMINSEIFHSKEELESFKQLVLEEKRAVVIRVQVVLPESEYKNKSGNDLLVNDISNMIKAIEDCIASNIGLDDKYNIFVVADKSYIPNNEDWLYKVTLIADDPGTMLHQSDIDIGEMYYDLTNKEDMKDEGTDS